MKQETVKAALAIVIIFSFSIACLAIVLTPVAIGDWENIQNYTEMLKNYSSVFSGLAGLVIGHYFTTKQQNNEHAPNN